MTPLASPASASRSSSASSSLVAGCSAPAPVRPRPSPSGSAPAPAAPQAAGAFAVERAARVDRRRARASRRFNGEFLFDGEGDEGQADFPWKGDPALSRAHRDAVGRVVRMLDADVVVMPETENLNALDAAQHRVARGHGLHGLPRRPARTRSRARTSACSRACPSTRPGAPTSASPVGVTDRQYGVSKNIFARMTLAGMPVTLIGVHFLAQPDNPERQPQREAQAEVIRRLVVREEGLGRQVIVLGDFNDNDDRVLDRRGSVPISNVLATIKRAGDGPADDLVNVIGDVPQASATRASTTATTTARSARTTSRPSTTSCSRPRSTRASATSATSTPTTRGRSRTTSRSS